MTGAAVLFNGIRVGEVTALALDASNPNRVTATIAVAASTPVRADTKVGLDFQGLTGVPVVALQGGSKPLSDHLRATGYADRRPARRAKHDHCSARRLAAA